MSESGGREWKTIIGVPLLILAISVGVGFLAAHGRKPRLEGRNAGDFLLPIVAGEGAGTRLQLSTLRGHAIVLDFWASWCGPCRESTPVLSRIQKRYRSRGVLIFGINEDENVSPAFVARAQEAFGASYPSLGDPDAQVASYYDVQVLPTLVLVDRRGRIRATHVGVPSENWLDGQISRILE